MEQHGQASTSSPPSVLRTAAWRAIWGALRCNQVCAARHARLTTRDTGRLTKGQACAALAAAQLRQLFVVITAVSPGTPPSRPVLPARRGKGGDARHVMPSW